MFAQLRGKRVGMGVQGTALRSLMLDVLKATVCGPPLPIVPQGGGLVSGERVDPASHYFRLSGLFETSSAKYDWLNRVIAVGIGDRHADRPVYNISKCYDPAAVAARRSKY
jgi:hypothetical protein